MNRYKAFSRFYDRLTLDVEYPRRADYLLSLFERHGCRPNGLLDLACGSGSLTVELAGRGMDMIGVDASADMLALASDKAGERSLSLLLLRQDMRQLDLYGTVEGAVCVLDSLNHLLNTADILQTFQRLRLFIQPGGLLIFDVNTPYKHKTVLGDNTFVLEEENLLCVWRNRLIRRTCEVEILLDFFLGEDGHYARFEDIVRERAYSRSTLEKLLQQAGFAVEAVYADMEVLPPAEDCERWVFVARNQ